MGADSRAPTREQGRDPSPGSPGTPYLGREERMMLERGKTEHEQTTASAQRALQVAEEARELAHNTLVEVHRQGKQLERAELGLEEVHREVKEASALLRFMQRWCCFQCCDCCDPTVQQDRTRKQRVEASRKAMGQQQQNVELHYGAKAEGVQRRARQHDVAYGSNGGARQELFARAGGVPEGQLHTPDIGFGLPEEDRAQIRLETEHQDELLDRIGDAVQSLHAMSSDMRDELAEQQPRVHRLADATSAAHDKLGDLTREARRV